MQGGVDLALVRACEERIVNCWPAVATMLFEGFVVRFANGYSGRANSATPIEAGADLPDETLSTIEGLYRDANLPSVVRVTPLAAPGLEARLIARGYRIRDESFGQIALLDNDRGTVGFSDRQGSKDLSIRIDPNPGEAWLAGVGRLQEGAKRNSAHLEAIVGRIRVPSGFATLFDGETPMGHAMIAIDRRMAEIGSVIIAPDCRGQGAGRTLIAALLAFARDAGAHSAFLQVETSNERALRLYRSFGFREAYRYRTLVRDS